MNSGHHNYEYPVDVNGSTAAARIVRMVGNNKRVLEIGAGPGSITRVLKDANHCAVTAIERDESSILKLASYCENVIHADLNDPGWPQLLANEPPFDVVVCADVLEHVYAPIEVLSGIARFLGEETSLIISLPHVGHMVIHACLFDSDFEYRDWGLLDRTHLHFFGLTNITALFATAGMKIVEAEFVVREPEQTEFAARWERLPAALQRELKANPTGFIYQIVARVAPVASKQAAVDIRSLAVSSNLRPAPTDASKWLIRKIRRYTSPRLRARIRHLIDSIGVTKARTK